MRVFLLFVFVAKLMFAQISISKFTGEVMLNEIKDPIWKKINIQKNLDSKSIIFTRSQSSINLSKNNRSYLIPENMYFLCEDLFIDHDSKLISTLLELDTKRFFIENIKSEQIFGYTYGQNKNNVKGIANFDERYNFILWAMKNQKFSAALLSLKRLLLQDLSLYKQDQYQVLLLDLYTKLDLMSFIEDDQNYIKLIMNN